MADVSSIDTHSRFASDGMMSQMASVMEKDGYYCVPSYLSDVELKEMQNFALGVIGGSEKTSVSLKSPEQFAGTKFEELANSKRFQAFFSQLYETATGKPSPEITFYQVLRCLTGQDIAKESLIFHYDSFLITALLPIIIPTKGVRGDFLMFPNTRPIRSTYFANLIDKMLIDNRMSQSVFKWVAKRNRFGVKRISLVPGNLYFFWGYRSIHTNEPCDADQIRSTALFHFADPHADSQLKAHLRR